MLSSPAKILHSLMVFNNDPKQLCTCFKDEAFRTEFFNLPLKTQSPFSKIMAKYVIDNNLVIGDYFKGEDFRQFMNAVKYVPRSRHIDPPRTLTWFQQLQRWCHGRPEDTVESSSTNEPAFVGIAKHKL